MKYASMWFIVYGLSFVLANNWNLLLYDSIKATSVNFTLNFPYRIALT